jgi:hypothetical protein
MWNEPDIDVRRTLIRELWEPDGCHVLQAPLEIRNVALGLGFPDVVLEVRGYDELEFRVTQPFNEFVRPGVHSFRARGEAARLGDIVKFSWEMYELATNVVVGAGTEVLALGATGCIMRDCQFIDA